MTKTFYLIIFYITDRLSYYGAKIAVFYILYYALQNICIIFIVIVNNTKVNGGIYSTYNQKGAKVWKAYQEEIF